MTKVKPVSYQPCGSRATSTITTFGDFVWLPYDHHKGNATLHDEKSTCSFSLQSVGV